MIGWTPALLLMAWFTLLGAAAGYNAGKIKGVRICARAVRRVEEESEKPINVTLSVDGRVVARAAARRDDDGTAGTAAKR